MRVRLILVCGAAGALSGCKSGPAQAPPAATPVAAVSPSAEGIAVPPAASELAGFAFLAGRWARTNPNKTVNREHWMTASGRSMTGVFQQNRPDGTPAFYEVSTIVVEPDGAIMLYHRHLHQRLAIDAKRGDADLFRLKSIDAEAGRAVFEPASGPAAGAAGILTMTYRSDGPDRLVQELAFKPGSKEKDFSTTYQRE